MSVSFAPLINDDLNIINIERSKRGELTMYQTLGFKQVNGVGVVTLSRPDKLNALNQEMFAELRSLFADLRADDSVKAVVLTGEGRAFCAGGDVGELASGDLVTKTFKEARIASKEFVSILMNFEKPLIAAINGIAAGGGAALVLCCDVIFASEKALFSIIFKNIGMIPDCATLYLLPRWVGISKAKDLCFTGKIIPAQEMREMGLAQQVVAPEELLDTAVAYAQSLAEGPTEVFSLSKILIDRSFGMSADQFFDYESLVLPMIMLSDDFKEGTKAFLEKRKPNFGGTDAVR